jgi:hypothetical protein
MGHLLLLEEGTSKFMQSILLQVTIIPTTVDTNIYQELFLRWRTTSLIAFNLVIYGGSCSFTVNDIANVTTWDLMLF